jgi:hypothetical protein
MPRYVYLLIFLGALFALMAINEGRQSAAGKSEPQEITCAQLVQSGFGDNAHVRMTDFYLCDFAYVYVKGTLRWKKAWVPAVPLGSDIHASIKARLSPDGTFSGRLRGDDIRIIVHLPNARSEKDVERAAAQDEIQGLLIKPFKVLDLEEQSLLEEDYPGLDYGRCLILVEGRRPSSKAKTVTIASAGFVAVALGVFLLVRHWRSSRDAE